jgi:ABC-type amino acid transport substrate-binding protein
MLLAVVLFAGTVTTVRALSDRFFARPASAAILNRTIAPDLVRDVPAVVYDANAERLSPITGAATLDGIRDRGVLRVGYGRDIIPFTYLNASGDLVGFDISFAYKLARDLHVRLELAPIEYDQIRNDLTERRLDIVMAGAYVTEARLEDLAATTPYFESPLAFITRAARAHAFLHYSEVAKAPDLKLGVLQQTAIERLAGHLFPKAQIVPLTTYDEFADRPDLDGVVWSLQQARAWASGHSGYTAVAASGMARHSCFLISCRPAPRH